MVDAGVSRWESRYWFLRKVPLFSRVKHPDLERIAMLATRRTIKAGEDIVTQGEAGDSMFIITGGDAEVVDGDTHLADLGVGDFLGEMALFRQKPRAATVRAKNEVTAVCIRQWDLDVELRSTPSIAIQMLGVLSDRLDAANQELARATGTPSTFV